MQIRYWRILPTPLLYDITGAIFKNYFIFHMKVGNSYYEAVRYRAFKYVEVTKHFTKITPEVITPEYVEVTTTLLVRY